jgi:tetratricopeptide (TPR) repeat protein
MAKQNFPKPDDEKELWEKIAAGSTEHDDYTKLGFIRYAKDQYNEAVLLYQHALTLPLTALNRAKVSNELGWLFNVIGQPVQTQTLVQSTIALLSTQPAIPKVFLYRGESYALRAFSLFWMEDNASGEEAAQMALSWLQQTIAEGREFDEIAAAYWLSANLYIRLEDTAKAITLCETCLQHQLGEVDRFACLSALGEALLRENKFVEAGRVIEEALQFGSAGKTQLIWCYFGRGIVQRSTGRLPEAIGTFQEVLATVKDDNCCKS